MSVGVKRSPVRPLSISNLSMAFPGELLIDPTTGNITYLDDSSNQIVHKKPGTLTIKYGDTTLTSKADLTTDVSVTIPAAGNASESTAGMMSPADKKKLDGIADGANKYVHPSYDAQASGLYKITVDASGHVSKVVAVAKADITALGIPGQDTKYTHPSHTAYEEGLYKVTVDSLGHVTKTAAVTKTDITALGIPAQDTVYSHPSHTAYTSGLYKITVDVLGHVSAATKVVKTDITGLGIPAQDTVYTHPTYEAQTSGLYKITVDETGHVSAVTAVAKADITALGIPGQDTKYTHPSYTTRASGLYKITVDATGHVSAVTAVTKADITDLGIPAQDTTYSDMVGATASAAGTHGLVPAPAKGDQAKYLSGAGTWVALPTSIASATNATQFATAQTVKLTGDVTGSASSKAGWSIAATLANSGVTAGNYGPSGNSAPGMGGTFSVPYLTVDAKGRVTGASTKTITMPSFSYSHPTHTAHDAGLYKITVDGLGHVTAATAVTKSDITALGIPGQDTKYTHPTYTARTSGLYKITVDGTGHVSAVTAVTKADITGLGIPAQDTKYTHPTYDSHASGLYKITVDGTGHVSAVAAVTKADITGLGIAASDEYLPLSGGTLTGNLSGKYITGTWLQTTDATDLGATPGKYPVLDSSGWLYYRTLEETKADLGISSSGVTAGNYGPTANVAPGSAGTFSVPYFTVDANGRVTAAATRTITMPTVPSIPSLSLSTSGSGNVVTGVSVSGHAITITKGSAATHAKYTATIGTGWSGSAAPYTIAVTVSGILASDIPIIDFKPSGTYSTDQKAEEAWLNVYRAVTAANKITFYAHEKPTVQIPINIICDR